MKKYFKLSLTVFLTLSLFSCVQKNKEQKQVIKTEKTAADILGNPKYLAISYGGYREKSRDIQPTVDEIKGDMKILSAMGIKILRTYNVQLQQAPNILKAITALKNEDVNFEMYMMLGAWIDCENAWTDKAPNHDVESEANAAEIQRAVDLANKYPEIVKVIAVGNEAMVKWAESYFVQPAVILKWVNHLQALKKSGELPEKLWITSSDDFASWGGGDPIYHTEDLEKLFEAVDYVSMHSYPYHNSHYNPVFWKVPEEEEGLTDMEKIDAAMLRAKGFAVSHYNAVANYMKSIGVNKPIHIGETGWATISKGHYGAKGSKATDEYKQKSYYNAMRAWTNEAGMSCFYFEAFDEQWKDAHHPAGSENHFGLINLEGQAKYPLWDLVDNGTFEGLTRNGKPITKTYNGDEKALMEDLLVPPLASE
ncbi:MAG: glycosyl hydrolase family 17 [Bacteroidetes bacterium]|nr:glycosyl hydrolase family 17 [Bacteroidota bacterium]